MFASDIITNWCSVEIADSQFYGNSATNYGGTLYFTPGTEIYQKSHIKEKQIKKGKKELDYMNYTRKS